jgi:hypothetical protein
MNESSLMPQEALRNIQKRSIFNSVKPLGMQDAGRKRNSQNSALRTLDAYITTPLKEV